MMTCPHSGARIGFAVSYVYLLCAHLVSKRRLAFDWLLYFVATSFELRVFFDKTQRVVISELCHLPPRLL